MKDYKWFNCDLHLEREYFKLHLYGFHIFNMIYSLGQNYMSLKDLLKSGNYPVGLGNATTQASILFALIFLKSEDFLLCLVQSKCSMCWQKEGTRGRPALLTCPAESVGLLDENWQPWTLPQGALQGGGGAFLISVLTDRPLQLQKIVRRPMNQYKILK